MVRDPAQQTPRAIVSGAQRGMHCSRPSIVTRDSTPALTALPPSQAALWREARRVWALEVLADFVSKED